VVHSHDVEDRLLEVAPDATVFVIPHHAGTPPAEVQGVSRQEARHRLGLPEDAFLVGQFGFITKPKQPAAVLGGFAALAERRPDARLLLVGENQTPGRALELLINDVGLGGRVRVAGFVDLPNFYLYLKAVDAVVNLRYPSAGEASGTFARALAEGRATIVNDLGSFAEVPPGVALKVEVDGDQREEVAAHLIRLAGDLGYQAQIEQRARRYAQTDLDQSRCAQRYLDVARSVATDTVATAAGPAG
jgi:glycosyltransferase involved in cell wall biosynthesis